MSAYLLQFDGAAEPNPGPAGGAYVIFTPIQTDPFGEEFRGVVYEGYRYMKHATNNEAEYTGLILGLTKALELGITNLDIEGDSNLIIQQSKGNWKVKATNLAPLQKQANKLLWMFDKWTINHVYRDQNVDADRLSKEAVLMKQEEHRSGC